MRIPVLTVLPLENTMAGLVADFVRKRSLWMPYVRARLPNAIELDVLSPAIPILSTRIGKKIGEALDPNAFESFLVRGHIDIESLKAVPETVEGRPVYADPRIVSFGTCIGGQAVGSASQAAAKLQIAELRDRGLDGSGVAIAFMDNGINLDYLRANVSPALNLDTANSWSPTGYTTLPGQFPLSHGTMCAFDALLAAPKATLLDCPILLPDPPGVVAGSISGRRISHALAAYSPLLAGWAQVDSSLKMLYPAGLVVNNSWGIEHVDEDFPVGHAGRFIDNPNHPFHQQIDSAIDAGIDIVFAAGNCGPVCASASCSQGIMGASAYSSVLTVGGCDVNDTLLGYSSHGPGTANLAQQKPDLLAYSHFKGSNVFGGFVPDRGTSTASAVAAGCVAALRSKTQVSPAVLFLELRNTARRLGGHTGWTPDRGYGIIDPLAAAISLGI